MNTTASNCSTLQSIGAGFWVSSILLPLSLTIFILNVVTFAIIRKEKKLNRSRFLYLCSNLSLNDAFVSFFTIIIFINTVLRLLCIQVPYLCAFAVMMVSILSTTSRLHVLIICIDRTRAIKTVSSNNNGNHSKRFVIGLYATFTTVFTYSVAIFCAFGNFSVRSCALSDIFGDDLSKFYISVTMCNFSMVCITIITYIYAICLLKRKLRQIGPQPQHSDETRNEDTKSATGDQGPSRQPRDANTSLTTTGNGSKQQQAITYKQILRFRRSMVTLVIIILAMTVFSLPQVVMRLAWAFSANRIKPSSLNFTDALVMLNPLFNPILYILRNKRFRANFKCRCS